MSHRAAALSQALMAAALVSLATFFIDPSSTATIAAVLVVALVAAVLISTSDRISPQTLAIRATHERFGSQRPPRQCDPDAAGHTRSRAPGC